MSPMHTTTRNPQINSKPPDDNVPPHDASTVRAPHFGSPASPRQLEARWTDGRLLPVLDPLTLRFTHGVPDEFLDTQAAEGRIRRELLDRVQVCPKCHCLPTFRLGCQCCGSGRVDNEVLIHHYACAHVGTVAEFDRGDALVCPKCLAKQLVVGADHEWLYGPYLCQDCDWSSQELEMVGHCLVCSHRFPSSQAHTLELIEYHAHRLDALGYLAAPG